MTAPIFTATVRKCTLVPDAPYRYAVHLSTLEGKQVEIVVRKRKSQRSQDQNRYYWGVVVEILAKHFGYEPEEMHEALKFKFLRTHAGDLPTVKSTAKLNTGEFTEYVDRVIRWAAAEHGCYVPGPNEVEYGEAIG
ncbi:MAG: hypothetical protein LLG06_11320 [Desulfobacteraceae bacterium]|nr:hypothetical protein [Desulfobacteraceae bacterium]